MTIALTSSVLGGGRQGATAPQENSTGLFSRFIGASGFQLINVNNVPLSLGSWSLDTKLLGRKAMINSLARHYFAQGISEAHKVRGFSVLAALNLAASKSSFHLEQPKMGSVGSASLSRQFKTARKFMAQGLEPSFDGQPLIICFCLAHVTPLQP